jgi:hypothetical protein
MATKESVEFIRDERGRKKKVVMSFRRYQALMEDLHDLAVLTKRRDEPAVSWNRKEAVIRPPLRILREVARPASVR